MYKTIYLPTYLVVNLFSYLSTYIWDLLFPTELVTGVKPNINSVEVHPQRSNNEHPVDGWCAWWVCVIHGQPLSQLAPLYPESRITLAN
jgi:hypothetical protein